MHGFFFSDSIENAQLFGNTIITANLRIKNPLDLRLHSIFNDQSQASTIWKILAGETLDERKALQTINNEIGLGEIHEIYDCLHNEDANNMMIAEGYDGILSSLGNEQIETWPFAPLRSPFFQSSGNYHGNVFGKTLIIDCSSKFFLPIIPTHLLFI